MGIKEFRWGKTRDGINKGGWDLFLTPKTMGQLGQLFLNKGVWGEKRLLRESYVEEMLRDQFPENPSSSYGFQTWVERDLWSHPLPAFRGYGGQDIFIIRELNAVVTFTGNIQFPAKNSYDIKNIVKYHILPVLH
jgi:CubicO group peptidase (beta-lactamase class C family)